MKRVNWLLVSLVLIGFVLGTLLAQIFPNSFLSYGQEFGLNNPVELNLGFLILTFGLKFHITLSGISGMLVSFVEYRFVR